MIIIENYNDRMILMKMNVVILIIGYILMIIIIELKIKEINGLVIINIDDILPIMEMNNKLVEELESGLILLAMDGSLFS